MDWDTWHKHIDAIINDHGQWIGLADENWRPICDLPAATEFTAGSIRLDHGDCEIVIPTNLGERPHRAVTELIADGLGTFSNDGVLVPNMAKARNIIVARRGRRQAYFVSHATAEGLVDKPTTLRIFGQDLSGLLAATPCPSIPGTWGVNPVQTWEQDAGGKYITPRDYGAVEFADVADGYVMRGSAVKVLREIVQDSVDAVCAQQKWDTPHLVVDMAGGAISPEITIRMSDQSVWDTVTEPARVAGVNVDVTLWWPGDDPVVARPGRGKEPVATTWDHPIGVVRIDHVEEEG